MDANGNIDEESSIASDPVPMTPSRGKARGNVFRSAFEMKDQLKQELKRPAYDVSKFYHETGFTQWVARHPRFEQMTLLVIALNAIWIFVDTDYNPGAMLVSSPPVFQIVENLFCMYFSFEWTMRFCAFKRKRDGLKDGWFVFDSLLVGTMFFETWVMTAVMLFGPGGSGGVGNASILRMARLLRLSRMARMARLLRAMPELLILCKGMLAAMRSVGFTLSLLFVILYVFGIAFVQLCDGSPCQELFPDVPNSMHTLLLQAALMDGLGELVTPLQNQNLALLIVLYLFVLLASLTVMNMLIGVICELVSIVAQTEKESLALSFVWEKVSELMNSGANPDADGDGKISKDEFLDMLGNKEAVKILHDTGVDVVGLVDLADEIFQEDTEDEDFGKTLTFEELMDHILEQRGANVSTVKDVQRLRKHVNSRFNALERKLIGGTTRTSTGDDMPPASASTAASTCPTSPASSANCSLPSVVVGLPSMLSSSTYTNAHIVEDSPRCDALRHASLGPYIPRIESSPRKTGGGFRDAFAHSMHGLLAAHECEVAFLQAENLRLRDRLNQLAKLTNSVSNTSISVALQSNSVAQELVEKRSPSPVLANAITPRKTPLQAPSSNGRRLPEANAITPRKTPLQAPSSNGRRLPEAPATAADTRHRHVRGLGMAMRSPGGPGNGMAPSGQSRDGSVDSSETGMHTC